MKIIVLLNAHGNTPVVADSVEALHKWVSKDILMLVDGGAWKKWGRDVELPVHKMQGLVHNYPKAPYRNLTYGLKGVTEQWPDFDWLCYTEYDVLFANDHFKEDLEAAEQRGVWLLGNDHRVADMKFPYLERMLREPIKESNYLLGCCWFLHRKFIERLQSINFFDNFLCMTNGFEKGWFPGYEEQGGYDFGEHLYPTLAAHFGGKVEQFANYNQQLEQWGGGNFKKYPMRWKPDLTMSDAFREASILHPVKQNSEIRLLYSRRRKS